MILNSLQPIHHSKRLHHIDIIRGLAIFGILLVNMAHYSYPDMYLYLTGEDNFFRESWSTADQLTRTLLDSFIQMKFITMFSFLFGFGMIMMMERAEAKGQNFVPIYVRRLCSLLLFGIIHAFFIWDGDILVDYAVLGFVLLLFRKRKPKTVLIWAMALYAFFIIPVALSTSNAYQENDELVAWQEELKHESELEAKQALLTYGQGSFIEIAKQRINDRMYYMSMNGMLSLNPFLYFLSNIPYFSMFLLGIYFAKRKILNKPREHRPLLKRIWLLGLVIGLPLNILYGLLNNELFLLIGAPLLMLFYVTSTIFLLNYSFGKRMFAPFTAVGRTAFTNYIMQSIIATTLFYNYGFGLYGKVNPFLGLFISIGIFLVQIIVSNWWLKRFKFGPLEWLWRTMTYKSVQSIR